MPLTRTHRHTTPRRSIFSTRRRAPARTHHTVTTTTTTRKPRRGFLGGGRRTHAAPVHHQQRRPSMKDKVSGALLKLKGSLTRRPGVKVRVNILNSLLIIITNKSINRLLELDACVAPMAAVLIAVLVTSKPSATRNSRGCWASQEQDVSMTHTCTIMINDTLSHVERRTVLLCRISSSLNRFELSVASDLPVTTCSQSRLPCHNS